MSGLAEALADVPKTGQTEREDSSTSSYQITNLLPAIVLSLPLWAIAYVLWVKPIIQAINNPIIKQQEVKVIQPPVYKLDGYLPEVRK